MKLSAHGDAHSVQLGGTEAQLMVGTDARGAVTRPDTPPAGHLLRKETDPRVVAQLALGVRSIVTGGPQR